MKKLIMLLALIVVAMISMAQDRSGKVSTGRTTLDFPINFSGADTIIASETYWILVDCKQNYSHTQSVTVTLDSLSGAPSLSISLEGKTSSLDNYTEIVSAATWDEESDNPLAMVVSTANKYRYFKIKIVASGATQKTKVTAVSFTDTYQNTTSVLATTGTFSGAVTTAALTASGLITANAGVSLGGGDNLVGSSTSNIAFNTDKFTVAGATGNTVVAGTLNVTGVTTTTAAINASGGLALPSASTVVWAKGGSTVLATSGTDAAFTDGGRFWVELEIPHNITITGLAYLVGSVGGTDSVVVQLCNSSGVQVATSRSVGGAAAIVGTAAQFQSVAFTAPYAAVAGKYYAVIQSNGTTAKFRAYPIPGSKFIGNTAVGVWQTKADITPGTTFVADKAPILMTY